jgi:hypothetical protein
MTFERRFYGGLISEEGFAFMEKMLKAFRFKKSDVNADAGFWSEKVITFASAEQYAIPESKLNLEK